MRWSGGFVLGRRCSVWFYGDNDRLLRRVAKGSGVAFNRLVNWAVQDLLRRGEYGDVRFLEELKLEAEVACLVGEANRLVRLQSAILKHGPYLKSYVDVLVEGGRLSKDYRERLDQLPGGVKAVDALERIFGRRQAISRRLAEVAVELLPGERYDMPRRRKSVVEPSLKKGWPPCPDLDNWMNKQFQGLPDRRYCSKFDRFVHQPKCWEHWNKGYGEEVFEESVELGRLSLSGSRRREHKPVNNVRVEDGGLV